MVNFAKLCYIGTDSFIVYVKTNYIYKGITEDIETRIDTSNSELDRPLSKRKNKKVIVLMKDELGGQIMKKFVGLIVKAHSYLKDNNDENKRAKDSKKFVKKNPLNFKIIKTVQKQLKLEIK